MKKVLLIFFLIFLTACGQEASIEQIESNPEDEELIEERTEAEEKAAENEQANKESDSEQKEEKNETPRNNQSEPKDSSDTLSELNVHYIDVDQADATLLQYADETREYTILFDTGDWRDNEVVNYLQSQEVKEIDVVAVSHPDADHIGQLADVIESFPVGEVWLSGNESSSDTFQNAMEAILASEADYDEPRAGDSYQIGAMEIDVFYPNAITGKSNEESIALKFTYGDVQFLFTGDAGVDQEMEIMQNGDVSADILHLGHHGSDTSSSPAFIDAVNPDIAIYSAGENNEYGHPSSEVVSRIQAKGIELYGTDVHGTIIITTDGKEVSISTKEEGTITPESTASVAEEDQADEQSSEEMTDRASSNSSCVDINRASAEELQEIIHIGPERAEDLIEQRPYQSISDLDKMDGIGPSRIADIEAEGIACTGG